MIELFEAITHKIVSPKLAIIELFMKNLKCLSVFLGTDWNVVQISADFSEFFDRFFGDENFPKSHFLLKFKRKNATKWQNTHVQKKRKRGTLFHKFHLKKDIQRFLHFSQIFKKKPVSGENFTTF